MVFTLKSIATMLTVAALLGGALPLEAREAATRVTPLVVGSPADMPLPDGGVRIVARYAAANVPPASHFAGMGLEPRYRYQSVPAWILEGPNGAVEDLVANEPNLLRVEYDRPLRYLMDTATFATNAVDVWGGAWWPTPVARKSPSPLTVDGTVVDGRGVTVGIVDSGINALHPDLWYAPAYAPGMPWSPKVLECTNVAIVFEPDVGNPYCDESVGHGTHVAGIVAGTGWGVRNGLAPLQDPDKPYVGAAPGAALVGAGLGAYNQILLASIGLDWMYANAEEFGIRVVTNSWGDSPGCDASLPPASDIVVEVTDSLVKDKGIVVLFAASNYAGSTPTWTSTYARNPTPGVISVANYAETGDALNQEGNRDGAINSGSSDGCVASGGAGDYVWTWPDVAAPGTAIASTAAYTGVLIPATWDPGMYASASGTSMATPHVAGIVALMLQANPELSPADVERILVQTSAQWPSDAVAARGRAGTTMWSATPSSCHVTPTDADRAEAGDTGVNAKFPAFTGLAQRTDAHLFVCRDFKRGVGLVDAYAAVEEALEASSQDPTPPPTTFVTIASPANGSNVPEGLVDFQGTVTRPVPPVVGGGGSLYFVGDGSTTAVTDADQVTNFGLSSLGNGGQDTGYATALGNNEVPENQFMPTFVGTERVHLSGGPVTVRAPVLYTGAINAVGDICPVDANLFDTNGTSLLPDLAQAFLVPSGDYQEAVFTMEPTTGTYESLTVQVGSSGLDCGRFPQVWRWGTDEFNGRLELGAQDWIGSAPVAPGTEELQLFVDDAATAAATASVDSRSDGNDAWATTLDLTNLTGPHTVTARWTEDSSLLAAATSTIVVEQGRDAALTIVQPASDGETLRGDSVLFGGGYSSTAGDDWSVDARILDGAAAVVLDWTRVALPAPDSDGVWSLHWEPGDAPDAALTLEARLTLDGQTLLTGTRTFQYDAPNQAPEAAIAAPGSAFRSLAVHFDASASSDPDGPIATYSWDFGDGATGEGASVDHTYSSLGAFSIVLTVTDADGATSEARHVLDVDNAPPTATLAAPGSARKGRDVAFDARASSDPDGAVRSFHWDFGDGEAGMGASPTHRFAEPGTYTVRLTVIDDDWRAAETTRTITVTK